MSDICKRAVGTVCPQHGTSHWCPAVALNDATRCRCGMCFTREAPGASEDDCEWCNGKDAPGEHENFCRLGLGPDEVPEESACSKTDAHDRHALTMPGDVVCPGVTIGQALRRVADRLFDPVLDAE